MIKVPNTVDNIFFSVLISLYVKEKPLFFEQSMQSIWTDQLTKPNEIVLVIDGVITDDLEEIVSSWKSRLKHELTIVRLENNIGLASALNEGLKYCKYDYVARMDTDDICYSERFEKQLDFFKNNPNCDILGSYAQKINISGESFEIIKVPTQNKEIHKLVWTCPFIHPSVMFKKQSILKAGGYNPNSGPRQDDYELWFRCSQAGFNLANLPEPLIYYRFSDENIKKNNLKVGWYRFIVGFKGCVKCKCGLIGYIGITIPLIRSLLPYPLNVYFYKFLNKINPRNQ